MVWPLDFSLFFFSFFSFFLFYFLFLSCFFDGDRG